jgi:S1-C subfamily serine protease
MTPQAQGPAPPGEPPRKAGGLWYLWGGLIGLGLALLFIVIFYKVFYPGLSQDATLATIDPKALQNSNIETLQAEIEAYRSALQGDVCTAPPMNDAAPLFRPRAPQPDAAAPEGGAQGEAPPQAPAPLNPTAGDNIEASTVMVLAAGGDSAGTGTGFFINDRQLLTNRHVVEDVLDGGTIAITSKKLGKLVKAEVRAVTGPGDKPRDYAVLEISDSVPHGKLKLQTKAQRMERVGSWGYPALDTDLDPKMEALNSGDFSSAPEVVYSEGVISVVQHAEGLPPFITHTADVSHGNSGGPLVNAQGEVLGINTSIRPDKKSNRQVNLSLASEDIVSFLQANGIPFEQAPAT